MSGCSTIDPEWDLPGGRPYRADNFVATGPIPSEVRRVGVLPLHSKEWRASDTAGLDAAFFSELGKFDRFETLELTRDALISRFDQGSFNSASALPAGFLERLRDDFGLDGVLFLDLTHFSPYQPISIGIRAKLVEFERGDVLWSFDSVFDSAQPDVALAARRYHQESSRPAYPLGSTAGILQSPSRFAKYVASAVFQTLPQRDTTR